MVLGATDSVKCKQRSLSYSPIGAVANELYSLKVAFQWFPTRRGAGCTALNYTNPNERERERRRGKKITAAVLLLENFFRVNESSIYHLNSIESRIICMLCQMAFLWCICHSLQVRHPPQLILSQTQFSSALSTGASFMHASQSAIEKWFKKQKNNNKNDAKSMPNPHSERLKAGILGTC